MGGLDQRKHPRFDGDRLLATLKVEGEAHPTVVENVSLGGALLSGKCPVGKNVLLELRSPRGQGLRLVGRVIATLPKGRRRLRPGLRVRFNPTSSSSTAELHAIIRALQGAAAASEPDAYEFHNLTLDAEESKTDFDIDIDVAEQDDEEQTVFELKDAVDEQLADEPWDWAQTTAMRIEDIERQVALMRRRSRTLEEVTVPGR